MSSSSQLWSVVNRPRLDWYHVGGSVPRAAAVFQEGLSPLTAMTVAVALYVSGVWPVTLSWGLVGWTVWIVVFVVALPDALLISPFIRWRWRLVVGGASLVAGLGLTWWADLPPSAMAGALAMLTTELLSSALTLCGDSAGWGSFLVAVGMITGAWPLATVVVLPAVAALGWAKVVHGYLTWTRFLLGAIAAPAAGAAVYLVAIQ